MLAQILYMMNGRGADPALLKGFAEAGCEVRDTHSIAETMSQLNKPGDQSYRKNMLLVAEVQAGAISLLTLMHENGIEMPPTMLFDQEGVSLQPAIKALQLGVLDYVLASESPLQREMHARLMAERIMAAAYPDALDNLTLLADSMGEPDTAEPISTEDDFRWDAEAHVIYVGSQYLHLSLVEGRIFDLLLSRRNHMVNMEELVSHGLQRDYPTHAEGIRFMRPHIMRLRNKLERYSCLAQRIVNVRAGGYMFI